MNVICEPGREIPINELIAAINSKVGGTEVVWQPGLVISLQDIVIAVNEREPVGTFPCDPSSDLDVEALVTELNSKTDK